MNVLPPEILSLILNSLYYSLEGWKRKRGLAPYLLVNKAFFIQARARIFSSTNLSGYESTEKLQVLKQILEYDAPGYPSLIPCVRHFSFLGVPKNSQRESAAAVIIRAIFLLLARPVSNLQTLEFYFDYQSFSQSFDPLDVYNALQSLCRVPTLQRLIIRNANSVPINFLKVANFKTLELNEVAFTRDGDFEFSESQTKTIFTSNLRHFRTTLRSIVCFPPEFIPDTNPSAFSRLERLAVHVTGLLPIDVKPKWVIDARAQQHLYTILSLSKHTLKHLEFLVSTDNGIHFATQQHSLAPLHKVEQLSYFVQIGRPTQPSDRRPMFLWNSMFQCLTSIEAVPPSLRHLLIHFHISSEYGLTDVLEEQPGDAELAVEGRTALLDILAGERFASVEQIKFVLHLGGRGATTVDIPFVDFLEDIREKYASRFVVVVLRDEVVPWFGISEYE